ncbi:MAG: DUF1328 domain-containing protein [Candidatus Dependentiae bacterium]|nr:DUF1328 domain-containing protein [Candidatus Dependentiae bacterium]
MLLTLIGLFFLAAFITGALIFSGLVVAAVAGIVYILFYVFLILFILSLLSFLIKIL